MRFFNLSRGPLGSHPASKNSRVFPSSLSSILDSFTPILVAHVRKKSGESRPELFLSQIGKAVWNGGQSLAWGSIILGLVMALELCGCSPQTSLLASQMRRSKGLPRNLPGPLLLWWVSHLWAAQSLYSWKTEIAYGKTVWKHSQKVCERRLEGKLERTPTNLQAEPRLFSEPRCSLVSQNWMGRGKLSPAFLFL